MKKSILLLFLLSMFLFSCQSEDEESTKQEVKEVHKSSITSQITINHIKIKDKYGWENDADVFSQTTNIYDESGKLIKTFAKLDTIPSLGTDLQYFDTGRTDADDEEIDTLVNVRKNYKVFVTVK